MQLAVSTIVTQPISSPTLTPYWAAVRAQFNPTPDFLHLGLRSLRPATRGRCARPLPTTIACSTKPPCFARRRWNNDEMQKARQAAARYVHLEEPDRLAMTDNTTTGLGIIYTGLHLKPGQEMLTTEHDYYAQHGAIRLGGAAPGLASAFEVRGYNTEEALARVKA